LPFISPFVLFLRHICEGWDIGDSFSRFQDTSGELLFQNLADRFGHKQAQMENVPCSDIEYNGVQTNTYYPPRNSVYKYHINKLKNTEGRIIIGTAKFFFLIL
jgi:hypothetical protein